MGKFKDQKEKKRKDPQVEFKKGSNIRRNKDQLIYNICHRDILTSDFWWD